MNALVFLQREAFGRDPGDFSGYRPGRSGKRIPVVLSQRECQLLFAQMSGTNRLMAQLMYGSGLRLMELLQLRIQDVNFEQGIIIVRSGKGGKDRVSALTITHLIITMPMVTWLMVSLSKDPGYWLINPGGQPKTAAFSIDLTMMRE